MMSIMHTFDLRLATGDILVHLSDERFSPEMRKILDTVVPNVPHGEATEGRVAFLRNHSAGFPKLHFPEHPLGPLCLEVPQPTSPLQHETFDLLANVTGALTTPRTEP